MPEIIENFSNWDPPFDVKIVVERLLRHVPKRYLKGLRSVVLTNYGVFNRKRRRSKLRSRGRKISTTSCLGLYHSSGGFGNAWIELFMDRIIDQVPLWTFHWNMLADLVVGKTLFHELGHHIHKHFAPEHMEKEGVADRWASKLGTLHARKEHPVVIVILRPAFYIYRFAGRFRRNFRKGDDRL